MQNVYKLQVSWKWIVWQKLHLITNETKVNLHVCIYIYTHVYIDTCIYIYKHISMPNSSKTLGALNKYSIPYQKQQTQKTKYHPPSRLVEEKVGDEMNCSSATWVGKSWISLTCCQVSQGYSRVGFSFRKFPGKTHGETGASFKGLWKKMVVLGWTLSFDSSWIPAKPSPAWHINEGTMARPARQQSSQPVIFFCRWMNTGTCKPKQKQTWR